MSIHEEFQIEHLLATATARLSRAGLNQPRADVEWLLSHLLGQNRAYLVAHSRDSISPQVAEQFLQWVARRADHFPLQYLVGEQEFFGRPFVVTPAVLIPRPETEILVETALELLEENPNWRSLVDIGTGTGCIAATLACERPEVRIVATDISFDALLVARRNACILGCSPRIDFVCSRSVQAFRQSPSSFDLIISNPPYIGFSETEWVEPQVARHEPSAALFAGADGTEIIREILEEAQILLRPQGSLLLEVGFRQAAVIGQLAQERDWVLESVRRDLAGIDRCLLLRPAR